jgi:hypothetical protein
MNGLGGASCLAFSFLGYNKFMTNEQILEKQVEALEKLLQLRSAIIEELETKVASLKQEIASKYVYPGVTITPYNPPITYPQYGGGGGSLTLGPLTCPDGTPHQYPSMWGGTTPPACSKCGLYPDYSSGITTISTTSGMGMGSAGNTIIPNAAPFTLNGAPVHTTGYMQPVDITDVGNANNVFTLKSIAK